MWNEKRRNNVQLEVDDLVSLMRRWFETHNAATDSTTPPKSGGRVHKVSEEVTKCDCCGSKAHTRPSCPLALSGKKLTCRNHPDATGHTTAGCRGFPQVKR